MRLGFQQLKKITALFICIGALTSCVTPSWMQGLNLDSVNFDWLKTEEAKEPVSAPPTTTAASEAPKVSYEEWHDIAPIYRLQMRDEIRILHPYSKELDQTVKILPDGRIYLPIVGAIQASDLSPEELSAKLMNAYAVEIKNPDITVIPTVIGKLEIFVGGQVNNPGLYEFNGQIGVVEATFLAGGLRNTANNNEIVVLRRTANNTAMMRTINIEAVLNGERGAADMALHQYDVVFVPRTTAAEIGVWVEQYITNILPFTRSYSYSVTK